MALAIACLPVLFLLKDLPWRGQGVRVEELQLIIQATLSLPTLSGSAMCMGGGMF